MASSGGSPKARTMPYATAGSSTVWQKSPMRTGRGIKTMRRKSWIVSPRPRPSMITPSASGMTTWVRKLPSIVRPYHGARRADPQIKGETAR